MFYLWLFLSLLLGSIQPVMANIVNAKPKIVVSIQPIYALTKALMSGIAEPELLIQQGSAHHFVFKPSQIFTLRRADLIIAIDLGFEQNLHKFLQQNTQKNILFLSKTPGLTLKKNSHHKINWHIWLSIDNALLMAKYITQKLSQIDVQNQVQYQANLMQLSQKLIRQKRQSRQLLHPWQDAVILATSNAYDYYLLDYFKQAPIYLSNQHEQRLSLSKLAKIKQKFMLKNKQKKFCLLGDNEKKLNQIQRIFLPYLFNKALIKPLHSHKNQSYQRQLDDLLAKLLLCLE